jgi:DNA-binding Lrp family transcriptional regulator
MPGLLDTTNRRLLDEFQRDLPLQSQPFKAVGDALGIAEGEVLARLRALLAIGMITRVGATVRPNTVGVSTLAAMAVPDHRIEEVATIVGEEPGVNHSYLREDEWNLWFVATAPAADGLKASLDRIAQRSGLLVLDLPLIRPFNIDLGFRLSGVRQSTSNGIAPDVSVIRATDRPLIQAMTDGMPLTPRPFAQIGARTGQSGTAVIERLRALQTAGIFTRIGVIVRHRAIGWLSNAMVVWELPDEKIEQVGPLLARVPGVTLCYQRRTVPGQWPFGLFSMIHARSRPEAMSILNTAAALPELAGARHRVLFSTRCFKQTGALVHREGEAA